MIVLTTDRQYTSPAQMAMDFRDGRAFLDKHGNERRYSEGREFVVVFTQTKPRHHLNAGRIQAQPVPPGKRKVSTLYGTGQRNSLVEHRETSANEVPTRPAHLRKFPHVQSVQAEMRTFGWLTTGSGKRFRRFEMNEDITREPFPLIVWEKGDGKYPEFDTNMAVQTVGDVELERLFGSVSYRAKNPYARKLVRYLSGGNRMAAKAPNPDNLSMSGGRRDTLSLEDATSLYNREGYTINKRNGG